jgi:hypothetical protein
LAITIAIFLLLFVFFFGIFLYSLFTNDYVLWEMIEPALYAAKNVIFQKETINIAAILGIIVASIVGVEVIREQVDTKQQGLMRFPKIIIVIGIIIELILTFFSFANGIGIFISFLGVVGWISAKSGDHWFFYHYVCPYCRKKIHAKDFPNNPTISFFCPHCNRQMKGTEF